MHFGASVREILTASYGADLRQASARTPLPELDTDDARRALVANLEMAFGVQIDEHDLEHLRTVRDVLQCVRLRRWERRVATAARSSAPSPAAPDRRATFVPLPASTRERLVRYTPSPGMPAAAGDRAGKSS